MREYKKNSFSNLIAGLGSPEAKSNHTVFSSNEYKDSELIDFFENDWLAKKCIAAKVDDMLLGWRQLSESKIDIDLDVKSAIYHALIYERVTGGGLIFFETGNKNTSKPLSPNEKIIKLVPLHKGQIVEIQKVIDTPISKYFGLPEFIEIQAKSGNIKIHISRVHVFPEKQPFRSGDKFWRPSILSSSFDLIRTASVMIQITEDLFYEKKTDTYKVSGLLDMCSTEEGTEQLLTRFALNSQLKSVYHATLIDSEEDYIPTELNLSGIKENILTVFNAVAAAFDYPMTRLFGMSPSGLNSNGEGDLQNYYQSVEAQKGLKITPFLMHLDRLTGVNEEWSYLKSRVISDKEATESDDKNIKTAITALQILPARCVVNFISENTRFKLTDEEIDDILMAPDFAEDK